MLAELPKGWVKARLDEVCLPIPIVRPEDSPDTEFTYFDIGSIDNHTHRISQPKIIVGRAAPSRARQAVRTDDILFSNVRTYLKNIARVEHSHEHLVASSGFTVIRPANGVSSRFLFLQVLSEDFLRPLHLLQSGSSYPAVRARDVLAQPILLAPAIEQIRLVEKLEPALSSIDRAENAARRAQERLTRYRAAVLEAALSGNLTRDWREARSKNDNGGTGTGQALLQRILSIRRTRWEEVELERMRRGGKAPKDERWKSRYREPARPTTEGLPRVPETWAWTALEAIAEIGSGIAVSQNRQVTDAVELPYLRVANVLRGYLDLAEVRTIRVARDRLPAHLLHAGDILFNEGGDRDKLGRGWVWEGQLEECLHQNHVFRARPFAPSLIEPKFVSHWGNTFGQAFFLSHGTQTTNLASISQRVLGRLPIPIPPLEEQAEILQAITARLTAADRLGAALARQLDRTQFARESLLREAFAGRLVPQDPKEEPASVLLDRIATEKAQREGERKSARARQSRKRSEGMEENGVSPESLRATWEKLGRGADAQKLFDHAGVRPENVVQFYETLRATPEVLAAFQAIAGRQQQKRVPVQQSEEETGEKPGRFRLIELWLEDFKNLKDYTVRFESSYGTDVVLGWNGTGKSNLFEALVIIFRDLHNWCERNRWPDRPMNGFRLSYEMAERTVEVSWRPGQIKRPELRMGSLAGGPRAEVGLDPIKRNQLPLPRFVFGYYSGPTNRLAEHFLPMKQAHYDRLRKAETDDAKTLASLLEQRRFFCAETHHAKYVLLAFSYKEDPDINRFLEQKLRIIGFESALFVIRKPRWAHAGSKPEDFWGATGIMRRVMERLRQYAIAPIILRQTVSDGYRSVTEDLYYFFLPDLASLHSFAAEYPDARTFFLALESTDFSSLIYDLKIQVRIRATVKENVSITFHQLSEGEQQLLMVLGLMRFTKSHQSLVLLDEPDTHLNPHWSVHYLKDLTRVMGNASLESPEQQTSQTLMATHDPLVIASLVKEQIHLLKRDATSGACRWLPASVNPRGLGFAGILTSEMFGFRSDLDPETLADLDNRVRLIAREESLDAEERKELEEIDQRLAHAGFAKAFSDPYYSAFVRAWGRRYSEVMAGEEFISPERQKEIDRVAREVLEEAIAEVEGGSTG